MLSRMAKEIRARLEERSLELGEMRAAIDDLAASCDDPDAAGEAGERTSGAGVAQVEAAFK